MELTPREKWFISYANSNLPGIFAADSSLSKWLDDNEEQIAREAPSNWISVDEPPKTNVPVLAALELANGRSMVIRAQYAAPKTLAVHDECEYFGEYDDATDQTWCPAGWYETNLHEEIHWAVEGKVLRWQPLPDGPKED